ncbi:hypothetical protein FGO68_gene6549 [Halteria grandinella]|uniref:Uncharacterized protein n=1 Tax=Halteria grandinella TaxID=5974 RepID=A0A8J8NBG1_HALGN|nr:hypothetical protein FGO68_gene6549 [Halteria grandinella]
MRGEQTLNETVKQMQQEIENLRFIPQQIIREVRISEVRRSIAFQPKKQEYIQSQEMGTSKHQFLKKHSSQNPYYSALMLRRALSIKKKKHQKKERQESNSPPPPVVILPDSLSMLKRSATMVVRRGDAPKIGGELAVKFQNDLLRSKQSNQKNNNIQVLDQIVEEEFGKIPSSPQLEVKRPLPRINSLGGKPLLMMLQNQQAKQDI